MKPAPSRPLSANLAGIKLYSLGFWMKWLRKEAGTFKPETQNAPFGAQNRMFLKSRFKLTHPLDEKPRARCYFEGVWVTDPH